MADDKYKIYERQCSVCNCIRYSTEKYGAMFCVWCGSIMPHHETATTVIRQADTKYAVATQLDISRLLTEVLHVLKDIRDVQETQQSILNNKRVIAGR